MPPVSPTSEATLPAILGLTFRLWWRNAVHIAFFNAIWLVLQLLIVTGPPATAALYVITHDLIDGVHVTPRDIWLTTRRMFVPAWKWGALNLAVTLVVGINFWLARAQTGDVWTALRLFWGAAFAVWTSINLLYWPLWLVEEDRRVRNTLRNGLVLLLHSPQLVLGTLVVSLISLAVSAILVIPFVNAVMVWTAALGLYTTRAAIERLNRAGPSAPPG